MPEYAPVFVTINGDIYFEHGDKQGEIYKWTKDAATPIFVKSVSLLCYDLFIDINNTLYCSVRQSNKIVSTWLNDNNSIAMDFVGTGSPGSLPTELKNPFGIFVDTNFDLYVADTGNNRIQRFRPGETNGITVAGNETVQGLELSGPTDVILDDDGYLFIADNDNHRIIRAGFGMFECIVGCSGDRGTASNELYKPYAIRFDSYGNLYVADEFNHRIQKFLLMTNFCGKINKILYGVLI